MVMLAERALAGITDVLGVPPASAWLGPEMYHKSDIT